MTNISAELTKYTPKQLVDFYKSIGYVPTPVVMLETCNRYGYDQDQMMYICEHLNLSKAQIKQIKHVIFNAKNPIVKAINRRLSPIVPSERVDAAMHHLERLHLRDDENGYIIFACKDSNDQFWSYAFSKLEITRDIVARILTVPNIYISVNRSRNYSRKTADISKIQALYLDIDNVNASEFLSRIKADGRFDKLEPSMIVDSGGGAHCYYYIKDCWSNPKLNKFVNRVQEALLQMFPEADRLKDISRILRLVGSEYRKKGKEAVISCIYESDAVYTIDQIGQALLPTYRPIAQKTQVFSIGKARLHKTPGSWRDLDIKRARDIERLVEIGYIGTDFRKRGMYLYRLFVQRATKDADYAWDCVKQMNKSLVKPLTEAQLKSATESVQELGKKYNYKTETLVELLELDKHPDIQKSLEALCTKGEKYARKKVGRKKESVQKKISKSQKTADKKKKAYDLLAAGHTQSVVAEMMGISPRTLRRIISN